MTPPPEDSRAAASRPELRAVAPEPPAPVVAPARRRRRAAELAARPAEVRRPLPDALPETAPPEAKPAEGRISNESPVGRALLGHKKGEKVVVKVPAGDFTYKITGIS